MNDITIITPPDMLYGDTRSILLINPSITTKQYIQTVLKNSNESINVYLYDSDDEAANIEWMICLVKMVNICIIDLDNCDIKTKTFASHIIAQSNTFYLTNDSTTPYNLISKNRIYDFTWLENMLINRGTHE
jgi:hypothetical protein